MKQNKSAFTLIELVMVIALIAIVSTLAVSKVGNLRELAARKVSLANQAAITRAVETFILSNPCKLNYLDNLINYDGTSPKDSTSGSSYDGFLVNDEESYYRKPDMSQGVDATVNSGLTPELENNLSVYELTTVQRKALNELGINFVMRHVRSADGFPADDRGEDGAYCLDTNDDKTTIWQDPNLSACVPVSFPTNVLKVMAVAPYTYKGRSIYREFGYTEMINKKTEEEYSRDQMEACEEVKNLGGPLVVFGIGSRASIIGNLQGGIETLPVCTVPPSCYYRRYLLVFQLKNVGNHAKAYFVGVLDPCGNTISASRAIVGNN